jgi:hypothetical protein
MGVTYLLDLFGERAFGNLQINSCQSGGYFICGAALCERAAVSVTHFKVSWPQMQTEERTGAILIHASRTKI